MAGGSLLMLLDDITTMLDDVSVMTKVAAKKTAGVLGDDLALNAQQVSGVDASRELPVVWAVAKGSFINKLILVPSALAISYFIPWLITPLLMLGGAFLCFEGFEKIAHKFFHKQDEESHNQAIAQAVADPKIDMVALEKDKIKGAIRTDFILSAEIIVIALGTVTTEVFSKQVAVVSAIALIMTVGVYGLVAGIVKLDDIGLHLMLKKGKSVYKQILRKAGVGILAFAPKLMQFLSVAGTAAMFLVGGSIIGHGLPFVHHFNENLVEKIQHLPGASVLGSMLIDALVGLVVGAICVAVFMLIQKMMSKKQQTHI
jgi:predicted DNA repair protein MutK